MLTFIIVLVCLYFFFRGLFRLASRHPEESVGLLRGAVRLLRK